MALMHAIPGQRSLTCPERVSRGRSRQFEPSPQWFAVYTTPRHEKCVQRHFGARVIEHFLPLYRTQHKWSDGSRATLDLPLFPNYIFVRIMASERARVLDVPGVLAIVSGTGGLPSPLEESEIAALQFGLTERNAEPYPMLCAGQRIRVRSGPFAGMAGVVMRNKGSLRIVLTIDLIQRSMAVEVDRSELDAFDSEIANCHSICA